MYNIQLAESGMFNGTRCDFYQDDEQDILMTREQIGMALEYENPMIAIAKIHDRHKDRLDKFSVLTKSGNTEHSKDGKSYQTYYYSARGIYEICRWSRQPKANDFIDWVWDVIEALRKNNSKPTLTPSIKNYIDSAMDKVLDRCIHEIGLLKEKQPNSISPYNSHYSPAETVVSVKGLEAEFIEAVNEALRAGYYFYNRHDHKNHDERKLLGRFDGDYYCVIGSRVYPFYKAGKKNAASLISIYACLLNAGLIRRNTVNPEKNGISTTGITINGKGYACLRFYSNKVKFGG